MYQLIEVHYQESQSAPANYIIKCLGCLVNHPGGLVVREAWYHMNDLSSTLGGHACFVFFLCLVEKNSITEKTIESVATGIDSM